ncbi:hypothetical protein [Pedobacter cryoconitis]|uniref:Lipocalin-like protein n=1 Tax=Pedobacter cryoconitis TaxID=188932 RepID=A0A327T0D5_9SPHI|nr:hypothetical protein [Pedobacter cryoconitis]RAJ34212.1 hypothetical protein LY11_01103 [Pedobacter cryoconitis]
MKATPIWKCLLLFLLIVVIACKKDKLAVVSPPELVGSWSEDVSANEAGKSSRGLMFSKDSIYFTTSDHASRQVTYIQGTYSTQENKLIANFKEIVVRQNNDWVISRTPVTSTYLENATYVMDRYKLTLNYSGSTSDGPKPAVIIFNRFQPD